MSRKECPNPTPDCKYETPFADTHHPAWPRSEYTTSLEKRYRQLGAVTLCRCQHDIEHTYQPPQKPSVEEMRSAIDGEAA